MGLGGEQASVRACLCVCVAGWGRRGDLGDSAKRAHHGRAGRGRPSRAQARPRRGEAGPRRGPGLPPSRGPLIAPGPGLPRLLGRPGAAAAPALAETFLGAVRGLPVPSAGVAGEAGPRGDRL